MERLLEGYRRFREETWPSERDRYEALSERGQRPETLVVACCDSRVDPQTIFGSGPGELFVVRNIAGVVPPYQPDGHYHGTSAALEFGARVLKVKRVVVLGHAQCGGVAALVDGVPDVAQDFVAPWMELMEPVREHIPHGHEHDHTEFETEVVKLSLENLRTFPWIAEAVDGGALEIAAFRFSIYDGVLSRLQGGEFQAVA